MVNPQKVTSILANLRGHREKLGRLARLSEAEFLADFTRVESAKHLLQVAIESCLDIAHHIVAESNFRAPRDSYDTFVVLAEEKILPDSFLPTLRQMVSFRNRVVHLYWDVDDRVVYQVTQANLGDLDQFASLILAYLERAGR
jgi:uncharacterized protein YutE (UPF0331/DUF86 family)